MSSKLHHWSLEIETDRGGEGGEQRKIEVNELKKNKCVKFRREWNWMQSVIHIFSLIRIHRNVSYLE